MFEVSLKNPNEGTWFYKDENDEHSAAVCLRVCGSDDVREINRLTIKKRLVSKNGVIQQIEDVNEGLRNELLWDFCIVDWENLINKDTGLQIPCTKEYKLILMGKMPSFLRWVSDLMDQLTASEKEIELETEKN